MRLGELPRRRLCSGERGEELDAVLGRRTLAEEAQRGSEPARGAGGRALSGVVSRFAQDRDGGPVAVRRGALDVVGARRRRRAADRERLGTSLVRAERQPPGEAS